MQFTYFTEDVLTTDWKSVIWQAAKVGQAALRRIYFIDTEELDESTTRIYYFKLPVGTVTIIDGQNGDPGRIPPMPEGTPSA